MAHLLRNQMWECEPFVGRQFLAIAQLEADVTQKQCSTNILKLCVFFTHRRLPDKKQNAQCWP